MPSLSANGTGGRPCDPVNALLSFIYTLLAHDTRSALGEERGLDPAVGFLHRDRPGRPGLALDLMEEFRPVIAGLVLVAVAIGLFIIDVFAPTHGVLTGGGVIAFFLGTFMLFDRSEPFMRLSLAWLVPATVITSLFFIFVVGAGVRAMRQPARTVAGALVGRTVLAVERIDADGGRVFLEGEVLAGGEPGAGAGRGPGGDRRTGRADPAGQAG